MPLPLTVVNALTVPIGTPHFTLNAAIVASDSSMVLDDGAVDVSTLPLFGNVRLLVYKTGDDNPEYVDMTSRSGTTLQIDRQTENPDLRPKCDHAIGAGVWLVATAQMFPSASGVLPVTSVVGNGSGDYTTTSSSFVDVTASALDMIIPANVGDKLLISGTFELYSSGGTRARITVGMNVGGTDDILITDQQAQDGISNSKAFSYIHTVTIGELVNGMVTMRPRFRRESGTDTAFFQNSGQGIPKFNVVNVSPASNGPTEAIAIIQDQKTQNTAGGTFTSGAWRTRDLNTIVNDLHGLVSLSSNQFTLQPGKYRIRASAPAYDVNRNQSRLYNITDSVVVQLGTVEYVLNTVGAQTRSIIDTEFVITAAKTYEIQHQCETTGTTNGFGVAGNFGTEIYTSVEITRIGPKIVSGDMVLLQTKTPTGTNVDFTNIPQTGFKSLKIIWQARGDNGAAQNLVAQFNGDTGANYDYLNNDLQGNGFNGGGASTGQTSALVGGVSGTNTTANYPSGGEITIPNYVGTTFYKQASAKTDWLAANTILQRLDSCWWKNTGAINEVKLTLGAGNFVAGSTFELYGIV